MVSIRMSSILFNRIHRVFKFSTKYRFSKYFKYIEFLNLGFLIASILNLDSVIDYVKLKSNGIDFDKVLKCLLYKEYKKLPLTYKDKEWLIGKLKEKDYINQLLESYMLAEKYKILKIKNYIELNNVPIEKFIKRIIYDSNNISINILKENLFKMLEKKFIRWKDINEEINSGSIAILLEYYADQYK